MQAAESSETIFEAEFMTVARERYRDGLAVIRYTRSEKSFSSLEQLHNEVGRYAERVRSLDRSAYVLLFDLRAVRGRNDDRFEAALNQHRPLLLGGFRRLAMLVRTEVGRLQISRQLRSTPFDAAVFREEPEALAWLLDG